MAQRHLVLVDREVAGEKPAGTAASRPTRHVCPYRCHVCPDCNGEVMPWCWGVVASGDIEDCFCDLDGGT